MGRSALDLMMKTSLNNELTFAGIPLSPLFFKLWKNEELVMEESHETKKSCKAFGD
ncbi:hypothetical protein J31TS3_26350 [Paenibacillus lactis]|nr:hypothetical protein J31TS3_26350 [Paenibacillus lactis]